MRFGRYLVFWMVTVRSVAVRSLGFSGTIGNTVSSLSSTGRPVSAMTPELYRACREAIHVIDREGSIRRGGRAMLFILEHEGWGPIARFLSLPPLIWFVELVYRFVAANRSLV